MRGVDEKGTWMGTEMVSSSALNASGVDEAVPARRAAEMRRREEVLSFIVAMVSMWDRCRDGEEKQGCNETPKGIYTNTSQRAELYKRLWEAQQLQFTGTTGLTERNP